MIKKITLAILLFFFVVSCGKKGDPEYKDTSKKVLIENMIIKII